MNWQKFLAHVRPAWATYEINYEAINMCLVFSGVDNVTWLLVPETYSREMLDVPELSRKWTKVVEYEGRLFIERWHEGHFQDSDEERISNAWKWCEKTLFELAQYESALQMMYPERSDPKRQILWNSIFAMCYMLSSVWDKTNNRLYVSNGEKMNRISTSDDRDFIRIQFDRNRGTNLASMVITFRWKADSIAIGFTMTTTPFSEDGVTFLASESVVQSMEVII